MAILLRIPPVAVAILLRNPKSRGGYPTAQTEVAVSILLRTLKSRWLSYCAHSSRGGYAIAHTQIAWLSYCAHSIRGGYATSHSKAAVAMLFRILSRGGYATTHAQVAVGMLLRNPAKHYGCTIAHSQIEVVVLPRN